ncbi:MAG: flagellin [Syntrophaceticus sp.]|nr:flagellin [Syntrophaceticus sp.]
MRINHNIAALNTYRQLSANQTLGNKALEKLSSGLRINRAGDDAAGLAISEKMRGQIRGLDQAAKNAQDGISLIQTAEGALNETHSILQRMRELAVQSANDTNNDTDRAELQKEVDQLAQEISRISDTTEFNTKKLLAGYTGTFHIGANQGQDITLSIEEMSAKALGVNNATATAVDVTGVTGLSVKNNTETQITISYTALGDKDAVEVAATTATFDEGSNTITITLAQEAGDAADPGAITATKQDVMEALNSTGKVIATAKDGADLSGLLEATTAVPADTTVTAATINKDLGIDISSQGSASAAVNTIQAAIESVSAERSKLGAYQNRLEHTINNLGTASENLTSAESRIRDVDMAAEMMEFTKMSILQQASTAMLAQANQQPQMVLQLLGG